jgi:arginine decarboxylase
VIFLYGVKNAMAAGCRTAVSRGGAVETPDRVPHAPAPDAIPSNRQIGSLRLVIRISRGAGAGPTRLAAFDTALHAAGVAGFNIVRLSSVIPPHAVVLEVTGADQVKGAQGDIAYCVYAASYASTPGEQAWAGVAWALPEDAAVAGLFVERSAASEFVVRRDLEATIQTMSLTRGHRYRATGQAVSSAVCVDHPVCAVVVATYGTVGWSTLIELEGRS